jgi:carboxymethylenebutenolidase
MLPPLIACGLVIAVLAAGCMAGPQTNATTVPTTTGGGDATGAPTAAAGNMTSLTAMDREYPAYVAAPASAGRYPGLVLLHSFNGLEPGYRTMCDEIAVEGFVVIAPEWQTYGQRAGDDEVEAVIRSAVAFLGNRSDVDTGMLGLTGFCAGGRYTMLFLPQVQEFSAGVAWYGFPYSGGFANGTLPVDLVADLEDPMLIVHGSRDQASNITDIYNYTLELDGADRYFELKVYQGKPHGFMVQNGTLARDDASQDAFAQMISFFRRTLVRTGGG